MRASRSKLDRVVSILFCLGSLVSIAEGDESPASPIPIPPVSGAIVIDGVVDEEAWSNAARFAIAFEVSPGENTPAPVTTEVRLTWDQERILVAFKCDDPEPSSVRARFSDRDQLMRDDWIGIVLDTFNDQRRAYEFVVNPLGVQMDALNDDVSKNYDLSWNAIWFSRGRLTATGYEVEMAIPFNQVKFQNTSGRQVWGLDFMRSYPRQHRHHLSLFARDRGNNSYLSQTTKIIGFEGARSSRDFEVVPTVTGSYIEERPDFPAGDFEELDSSVEGGVTAGWGVTPNTTLTAAVNPDFSQIEADAVKLDINETFALFFQETRPFFQVGADYFNTELSLLHTRTIVDPGAAIKVTGKSGRHTYGFFSAKDDVTALLIPGAEESSSAAFDESNISSVARYRFDFGENSTVGAMVTDRAGRDGYSNRLISGDLQYRISENDTVVANLAWSQSRYNQTMIDEFDLENNDEEGRALLLDYHHTVRNWGAWVWYRDISEGYRADLGFQPDVDFRTGGMGAERYWWGESGDWYNRLEVGIATENGQRQDGSFFDRENEAWFGYEGPYQSEGRIRFSKGTRVHGGTHFSTDEFWFETGIQPHRAFEFSLNLGYGDWIDFLHVRPATRSIVSPEMTIRVGRHLLLDLGTNLQRLEVDDGRLYSATVSELRGVWQFNLRTFARLIVQHTDISRDPLLYDDVVDRESSALFTQFLMSYKVDPRTVVYLGYSDGARGNEHYGLKVEGRALFAKIGYSFQL